MSKPQNGPEQTSRAKGWRALGYDGVSLITIPAALLLYWPRGDSYLIKGLGLLLIFVLGWLYARLRRRSEE